MGYKAYQRRPCKHACISRTCRGSKSKRDRHFPLIPDCRNRVGTMFRFPRSFHLHIGPPEASGQVGSHTVSPVYCPENTRCCTFVLVVAQYPGVLFESGWSCPQRLSCPRNGRKRSWSVSERMVGFWQPTWLRSFKPPKTRFAVLCAIWQLRDYARVSMGAP